MDLRSSLITPGVADVARSAAIDERLDLSPMVGDDDEVVSFRLVGTWLGLDRCDPLGEAITAEEAAPPSGERGPRINQATVVADFQERSLAYYEAVSVASQVLSEASQFADDELTAASDVILRSTRLCRPCLGR